LEVVWAVMLVEGNVDADGTVVTVVVTTWMLGSSTEVLTLLS